MRTFCELVKELADRLKIAGAEGLRGSKGIRRRHLAKIDGWLGDSLQGTRVAETIGNGTRVAIWFGGSFFSGGAVPGTCISKEVG